MLQNAYLLANIDADTAENEWNFAKILKIWKLPASASRLLIALDVTLAYDGTNFYVSLEIKSDVRQNPTARPEKWQPLAVAIR